MIAEMEKEKWFAGWRGVGLVAITYIYFLLFAQFGFLKRLADLGIAGDQLKIIMGAMAVGGILTSLMVAWFEDGGSPDRRLQAGFFGCAMGAGLTLLPLNLATGTLVSLLIGIALGLLTVTLVAHLNLWIGEVRPLAKISLGVGLAYFVCNCPRLFEASPAVMAICSACLCLVGIGLAAARLRQAPGACVGHTAGIQPSFWLVLGCFTALVWLDSAAFYIIQNTPELKSGTWEGSRRLWQNGGVHFLAALAGGMMLSRRGLSTTLGLAFVFLACACWLLLSPGREVLATLFYPMGVSLYSVALVAYPSYLAATRTAGEKSRIAGRLYAVAGWIGSGLGIGMAENLRRIPPTFVLGASFLFFAPFLWRFSRSRMKEVLTTIILLAVSYGLEEQLSWLAPPTLGPTTESLVCQGREVYISEGCIHCHSQYVRPNSKDEIMWGPVSEVQVSRSECPPLIGNRRQGPDLTEVGNRRSVLWLRVHFMNPAALSHNSPMPAYAHLFDDRRGEALIAYLESLGATNVEARLAITQTMPRIPDVNAASAQPIDGAVLLQKYCATCHAAYGMTRQTWTTKFKRLPPDFVTGPFLYAPIGLPTDLRVMRIAQIIRFGLPGTDMPGHEYLADEEIAALADQIIKLAAATNQVAFGDRKG